MHDRIEINPHIQHGKPVIRGTRVPVTTVLSALAGRMARAEIVEEYGVSEEDIDAALVYAVELVEEEQHYPLPASVS
ncbi:MAG TPA: DUF433 domain-containing protein [Thermoanaerobaculia bacterium]